MTLKQLDNSFELPRIVEPNKISSFFPSTPNQIEKLVNKTIKEAQKDLKIIIYSIKDNQRTFENTLLALDRTNANFIINFSMLHVLSYLSPDDEIRKATEEGMIILQNFSIENFVQNKELYEAINSYNKKSKEKLNISQKNFLSGTLEDFRRNAIEKGAKIQENIKKVQKEIALYSIKFEQNISRDNRFIKVKKEELKGLSDDFINNLKISKDNYYILTIDTPTFNKVMEECAIESTRKSLWQEYQQRAYPANQQVLNKLIESRDKLAKLLNFNSYADLDLKNQMAKNPEIVRTFLDEMVSRAQPKSKQELEILKKDLPESVKLIDGKFKPWDLAFTINHYKIKYFSIDKSKIAEYFPLQPTLDALFEIYEIFFSINFKKINVENLWHPDVQVIAVYKNHKFLGTLLLDLFPRNKKYSHACALPIIPGVKIDNHKIYPAVIMVITNLQKPTKDKPALLDFDSVITFFHECGHAIHSFLGTTKIASQSGINVKWDFVELPSQMLEFWLEDKEILKKITKHYKTGKPLPDKIIDKLLELKNFAKGFNILVQAFSAFISLDYYSQGANKDIRQIWEDTYKKIIDFAIYDEANVRYCSFTHLTSYGSKYYGYLWSRVYALDVFSEIKKRGGLLDKKVGSEYVKCILSKGGSINPAKLLYDFLKREPNSTAFFNYYDL